MILLASGSPRRAELLRLIGVGFHVRGLDLNETPYPEERPADYVERLAREKAEAGWSSVSDENTYLAAIGADTSVVLGGDILGKPTDEDDHFRMMSALSGQQHEVISAIAVTNGETVESRVVLSQVRLKKLTPTEIEAYWKTGEPADKAGGYAIQGLGSVFVEFISGSYSSVVGLPVKETAELLTCFGVDYWLQGVGRER